MKSLAEKNVKNGSFWLRHPDPTQAAVHLALQWLAYVYPASGLYVEDTLRQALPYADEELNSKWRQFLQENDVEEHVHALRWLARTLSREQVPFLVESGWRLLLVSHQMPNQVPLALRLVGRILDVPEFEILEIGEQVQREVQDQDDIERAPLLPQDPRYLDRVEWRLYGDSRPVRGDSLRERRKASGNGWRYFTLFTLGSAFGALLISYLVWGPMQLGRQPVPRMSHLVVTEEPTTPGSSTPSTTQPPLSVPEPTSEEPSESADAGELSQLDDEAETQVESPVVAEQTVPDALAGPVAETGSGVGDAIGPEAETPLEAPAVDAPDESREALMTVTASVLNVRARPSIDSEVVMKLGDGARVWVDPARAVGDWQHIRVEGVVGYASGRYMKPAN